MYNLLLNAVCCFECKGAYQLTGVSAVLNSVRRDVLLKDPLICIYAMLKVQGYIGTMSSKCMGNCVRLSVFTVYFFVQLRNCHIIGEVNDLYIEGLAMLIIVRVMYY